MAERDPRLIVAQSPMGIAQIVAVAITIALNALDGFDVLSISFASPGIAAEWHIGRAALGIVLSMELFGMGLGSVVIGSATDRYGRRPVILGCLGVMAIGMFMVTTASSLATLLVWRLFTGLGIGGMLAATNAVAAEYANQKNRNLAVSLMAIGYPLGAVIGGSIVALLLKSNDWRIVFYFGGSLTLIFLPLVWFFLPETIGFLCEKQGHRALERVNAALRHMGHSSVEELPAQAGDTRRSSVADIFRPALIATTLLVTVAYFMHIATFYFVMKWLPKIIVDIGFAPAAAAGVLVWANVGGASGGALFGILTRRFPLRALTVSALLASVVAVSLLGRGYTQLPQLSAAAALAGFFTNAAIVGLYATLAQGYPTHLRATGTGFTIGVGRAGAALSPIVAGYLLQNGLPLQSVAIAMASGAAIAAIALALVPRNAHS